jgi:hypothetical protein
MKTAAITLAAATLLAGAAQASDRLSDVDYLRANRCSGLASKIDGVVDPAALAAFVKDNVGARPEYIVQRGQTEFKRAQREARNEDSRTRLTAELSGPCQAFLSGGSSVANKGGGQPAS